MLMFRYRVAVLALACLGLTSAVADAFERNGRLPGRLVPAVRDDATGVVSLSVAAPEQKLGAAALETRTGSIVVELTVTLKNYKPVGYKPVCFVQLDHFGAVNYASFGKHVVSNATVSGSTVKCRTVAPFNWTGVSASGNIMVYAGIQPNYDVLPTATVPAGRGATFITYTGFPANGGETKINLSHVF